MFAILITDHHLFGTIFQPYWLEERNEAFYTLSELITKKNAQYESLAPTEKRAVDLCDDYSESNVLKCFSREKITFVEFVKRCEKNPKECERFLPFIAKSNYKVATFLMAHNEIPLFFKKKNYINIYKSDRLLVPSEFTQSAVSFELVQENGVAVLSYSLKIFQGDEPIPLKSRLADRNGVMLSNEPCCALMRDRLCLFESLTYSKLKPFFEKDSVKIEGPLLENYMHTFVKKSIREGNVIEKGFEILNEEATLRPILRITEDLGRNVAIALDFQYGDFVVDERETASRLVKEEHENGRYKFRLLCRDLEAEENCRTTLSALGLKPYNYFYYYNGEMVEGKSGCYALIDFLKENESALRGFDIRQELGDNPFALHKVECAISVAEEGMDWFCINAIVRIGDFQIPFYKFRKHIASGNREYELPDGTLALLPEEWFAKYSGLLNYAKEENEKLLIHRMYFNILGDFAPSQTRRFESQLERQVDTPSGIRAQLRSYQQTGYSWLVALYESNFGGCLADDMGLGKTLQFLSFFEYVYHGVDFHPEVAVAPSSQPAPTPWPYDSSQPSLFDQVFDDEPTPSSSVAVPKREKKPASLVVLPTSLLFNWQREKEKFAPHLKSLVYSGAKRVRSKQIGKIFDHYDLIFTTYGVIRNDIDFLKEYHFECLLLDESQNIKNPDSIIYKTVISLNANHHFVISGTPIENSLNDLWAQMNFANRNIFGSQKSFKNYYVQPIMKQQNDERERRLQQLIKPFVLRRTKSEVAKDLPPMIEQTILCEMTDDHRKFYEQEMSSVRNEIMHTLSSGEKNGLLAITALLRLRQISNHPRLVKEDYEGESSKLEEVISRIESLRAENHKVLVFSTFLRHLKLVAERLDAIPVRYEMLTGETTNRETVINNFQNDSEIGCFLISLKAGGVGLNLMAADYVFILDPWWNLAAESQAINRAHRIGQDKTVMVYRFIMAGTIEEKIQNLQNEKSKLAETFINNNNPFLDLSSDDLEKLLG